MNIIAKADYKTATELFEVYAGFVTLKKVLQMTLAKKAERGRDDGRNSSCYTKL